MWILLDKLLRRVYDKNKRFTAAGKEGGDRQKMVKKKHMKKEDTFCDGFYVSEKSGRCEALGHKPTQQDCMKCNCPGSEKHRRHGLQLVKK